MKLVKLVILIGHVKNPKKYNSKVYIVLGKNKIHKCA